jgi:hypothetical protein
MHDPVNSPEHYASGAIECIEAIEASMNAVAFKGFLKGNCQKYLWRYEAKGGSESLKKCRWYLDRLIAIVEQEESTAQRIQEQSKEVIKTFFDEEVSHDPDDYMASGCPDGFCPLPSVRQGPSEPMFPPAN